MARRNMFVQNGLRLMPGSRRWLCGVLVMSLTATAWSQDPPSPPTTPTTPQPPTLTLETIDAQLKDALAAEGLDEAVKTKITEIYGQAKSALAAAKAWEEKQRGFQQKIDNVNERLEAAKADLEKAKNPPPGINELLNAGTLELPRGLDQVSEVLTAYESTLKEYQNDLDDPQQGLRKQLADVKAEDARRAARPAEIAKSNLQQQLDKVREQLNLPPKADESPLVAQAQKTLLEARAQELTQQLAAEKTELAQYQAADKVGLLRVRRDALSLQVALYEKIVKSLQDVVNKARQRQAQLRAKKVRDEVISTRPELKEIAESNAELAEENIEVTQRIQAVQKSFASAQSQYEELKKEFDDMQNMIEAIGQTDAIGVLLRTQRKAIPDASHYANQIESRQSRVSDLRLKEHMYETERDELTDIPAVVAATIDLLQTEETPELKGAVAELLETRKTLLEESTKNLDQLSDTLLEANNQEIKLMELTESYKNFIDERVMWIRSNDALGVTSAQSAWKALQWMFDSAQWWGLVRGIVSWRWQDIAELALTAFLFVVLIYYRRRLRAGISSTGETAKRGSCRLMRPTVQAAVLTLIVAAIWPSIVWYFSWRVGAQSEQSDFTSAISHGLAITAAIYLPLEVIRQCCASKGLAEMHFYWSNDAVRTIRTHLRWATPLSLPLIFVAATIHSQPNEVWQDSLGRICVVIWLIVLTVFWERVLNPHAGVVNEMVGENNDGWRVQLRYLIYGLGVLLPLSLAALAAMGYYYSIIQLGLRLGRTLWLVITLMLVHAMLSRWLLMHRRGLAIDRARAKREREREEQAAAGEQPAGIVPTIEPQEVDLATSTSQTQNLIRIAVVITGIVGMWLIWADMMTALSGLNKFSWWSTTVMEVHEVKDPITGAVELREEPHQVPVTIVDIFLAIVVAILAIVGAQNIPGLIEMSLLRGLPFEPGFRYAISSLARYAIVLIGLAVSLAMIGIGWSQMQWLFAAASLGLGFGLQEIFANFVSGIIILFERPVRVGDIITIGDVSGMVSKIRIRATTITDWDRKELIVPNKEFITGRLLNWTLTDPINRVVVNVGVAYGSDTKLARELLLRAAEENEFILKDPAPLATFEGFGDSTLDFVLRAYLPNLENRLAVIHALHTEIDRMFREANVEIAFPQRDIHIRTAPVTQFLQGSEHTNESAAYSA